MHPAGVVRDFKTASRGRALTNGGRHYPPNGELRSVQFINPTSGNDAKMECDLTGRSPRSQVADIEK